MTPTPHGRAQAGAGMTRRQALKLLGGAGAGVLLGGCGTGGEPTGSGPRAGATTAASGSAGGEPTTLTYWTWLDSNDPEDPRADAQRVMIERFHQQYPEIVVVEEVVPFGDLHTRLLQAATAGTGPDVSRQGDIRIRSLAEAGAILPLDDFTSDWSDDEKTDYLYLWEETVFDGKKYAFRQSIRPSNLLYYRTDLLEAAGFSEPPGTEDAFTDAAIAMTQGRVAGFAMPLSQSDGMSRFFQQVPPMLWGLGSNLVDPNTSEPLFQEDAGVEVMQWFQDMVHKHGVIPEGMVTTDAETLDQQFKAGVVAMMFGNTGDWGDLSQQEALMGRVGYAPFPNWGNSPSLPGPAHLTGWTYVMPKGAQEEAAWKFIEFTQTPEVDLLTAEVGGEFPNRVSTLEKPFFDTSEAEDLRNWLEWVQANPHPAIIPSIREQEVLTQALGDAVQQIIANRADVPSNLERAAEEYRRALG